MKNSIKPFLRMFLIILVFSVGNSFAGQDVAEPLIESAKISALRGDFLQAREFLRKVPLNSTLIQQAYLEDIRIDYYSGDINVAYNRLNTILSKDPLNISARTVKAEFLRMDGQYNEAESEIEKIKKVAPTHVASNNELGMIKIAKSDYNQAIQVFTKVLALDPLNEVALLKRSKCFREIGKPDLAIEDLKTIIEKKPSNTRLRIELVDSLLKLNKLEEAFNQIKIAYKLQPTSIEVVEKLADLYVKRGDDVAAVPLYEKVLDKMPGYAPSSLSLAAIYTKQNKDSKAEELLTSACASHPTDSQVAQALAANFKKTNQLSKLGIMLKSFIEKNPNSSSAWASMNYAQLLISVEEYKKAREVLTSMHKRTSPTVDSELALAFAMAQTRSWDDVYSLLSKSSFADPRIKFNLALAAEELDKPEIALENYKKITPNSKLYSKAKVNSSLVFERQGKFSEAIEELSQVKTYENELNMDVDAKLTQLMSKMAERGIASKSKEDSKNEKSEKENKE